MGAISAEENEQNVVTVRGEMGTVVFKQIAGLLARRIVFIKKVGRSRSPRRACRTDQVWVARGRDLSYRRRDQGESRRPCGRWVLGTGGGCRSQCPDRTTRRRRDERRHSAYPGRQARVRARRHKGLYILPSFFTAANIAAGYYAISQAIQGTAGDPWHFDQAAKAIGFAILFDGLDGRIARLTNTTSAFGRELDSLADVIAFGIAPAILAWLWGFRALPGHGRFRTAQQGHTVWRDRDIRFPDGGSRSSGALQHTESTRSRPIPGRPGQKYFVGMPIPAGAGVVAAVVHFVSGNPLQVWWLSIGWGVFVFAIAFLMVSTWRFYSFKELNLRPAAELPLDHRLRRSHRTGLVLLAICAVPAGAGVHPRGCAGAALLCFPAANSAAPSSAGRGLARLMKNDPKTTSGTHPEAGSWGGLFRVAIVGAASASKAAN